MIPQTAKQFFEAAAEQVDSERNPAMWTMLAGLVKLAEQVQRIEYEVQSLGRKVDSLDRDVKRLKRG